jgi:hypothetical protein
MKRISSAILHMRANSMWFASFASISFMSLAAGTHVKSGMELLTSDNFRHVACIQSVTLDM